MVLIVAVVVLVLGTLVAGTNNTACLLVMAVEGPEVEVLVDVLPALEVDTEETVVHTGTLLGMCVLACVRAGTTLLCGRLAGVVDDALVPLEHG